MKRFQGWPATLLFSAAVAVLAAQDRIDGLLPPASPAESAVVAGIRHALAANDLAKAQREAEAFAAREPRRFDALFWTGYVALRQGRHLDAIRALRRAEGIAAQTAVLKVLAVSYYSVHQEKLFLLKMQLALEKDPTDFAPYYYLGRYYDSDASEFSRAAEYLRKAVERRPEQFRSHYYLGHCYEMEQKPEQAEGEYRKALELAPSESLPNQGLARLRLAANEPAEALGFAQRAAQTGPLDSAAHKLLARVYADLGRAVDAGREWKLAATLDPTDAVPLYRLYRYYAAVGKTEEARVALAEYKKIAARYGTN
jgi:tetratricopeptide (TPR) repeat protein